MSDLVIVYAKKKSQKTEEQYTKQENTRTI